MTYSPSTPFSEYFETEQKKYPEFNMDDIQTLKNSLADDENLPPITDKQYLAFLHSCNFDLESTKRTIKKCYRYHFSVPQVFCEVDPISEDMENCYKCVSVGQMPATNTDKSDRILYMQFKDTNPSSLEYVSFFKYLVMWMNYTLLMYGTCDGLIVVMDSKGLSWRHIIKLPIGIAGKMLKFLETGLPIRLKTVHVLNAGSATQMLMKVVTRFANQELLDKIKLHSPGSMEIFDYVPELIMPIEIGGLGKSHNHFNDELYRNMIDIRNVYLEQNEILNNQMMYINQQFYEDED